MGESTALVVWMLDDDPTWLRSLGRWLTRRGAETRAFSDAAALLEAAEDGLPDAMSIDFVLGGEVTGADVARAVRERLRGSAPPLALISGTLEEVPDAELALFDLALHKTTSCEVIARRLTKIACTNRSARSGSQSRSAILGDLGRDPDDSGDDWGGPGRNASDA